MATMSDIAERAGGVLVTAERELEAAVDEES
jgi:hypothetical protein